MSTNSLSGNKLDVTEHIPTTIEVTCTKKRMYSNIFGASCMCGGFRYSDINLDLKLRVSSSIVIKSEELSNRFNRSPYICMYIYILQTSESMCKSFRNIIDVKSGTRMQGVFTDRARDLEDSLTKMDRLRANHEAPLRRRIVLPVGKGWIYILTGFFCGGTSS